MTSIRTQIDAHSKIVAEQLPDGRVAISTEDLNELVELAHEAVHPLPPTQITNEHGAQRLLDAIFSVDTEGEISHEDHLLAHRAFEEAYLEQGESNEGNVEPEQELDLHEVQLRGMAMQFATAYVTTQIQASHGLDSTTPDLVGHAESILHFLKSKG